MRRTRYALNWIVKLLRKHKIPFQISGGFAANIYGSNRSLADIDIEVSDKDVLNIQKSVKKYIIYGPMRYRDKEWDLLRMTLKYKNQEIDICGIDSQNIFDRQTKKWTKRKIDLPKSTRKKVYNLIVPIIPIKNLMSDKKKISRDVDIQDIKTLSNSLIH